ncbi:hypothetical protein IF2G_08543 [Cordyceps javanica]|nr:hypothetical protein IF2G_08543 [Cordyceps javanica]
MFVSFDASEAAPALATRSEDTSLRRQFNVKLHSSRCLRDEGRLGWPPHHHHLIVVWWRSFPCQREPASIAVRDQLVQSVEKVTDQSVRQSYPCS